MIALRPREQVLAALLAGSATPLSRWQLVDALGVHDDDILRIHLSRLRRKLGAAAIRTIRCVGYELTDEGRIALATIVKENGKLPLTANAST